jgi:hypothetical protein
MYYIYITYYTFKGAVHISSQTQTQTQTKTKPPPPPPHTHTPQVRRPDEHHLARHCGGVFKGSVEMVIARRAPLAVRVCGICGARGAEPRLHNALWRYSGAIKALLRRY